MEPTKGIGPLTSSLPKKCSTTELRGRRATPSSHRTMAHAMKECRANCRNIIRLQPPDVKATKRFRNRKARAKGRMPLRCPRISVLVHPRQTRSTSFVGATLATSSRRKPCRKADGQGRSYISTARSSSIPRRALLPATANRSVRWHPCLDYDRRLQHHKLRRIGRHRDLLVQCSPVVTGDHY